MNIDTKAKKEVNEATDYNDLYHWLTDIQFGLYIQQCIEKLPKNKQFEYFQLARAKSTLSDLLSYLYTRVDEYGKINQKKNKIAPLVVLEENLAEFEIALRKSASNQGKFSPEYKCTLDELKGYCNERLKIQEIVRLIKINLALEPDDLPLPV